VDSKPTTAELVVLASGAVVFIFSFFDFYAGTSGASFWPLLLAAIFGLVAALAIALPKFANVSLPDNVAGLSWNTLHLMLGFYCAAVMIGTLLESTSGTKIGFWLMLIGGIGLLVGAFLLNQERAGARGAGPGPAV